jgi:dihydrofolate reductase
MKGSVFVATSLDGYLARLDGGIDWLEDASGETGEDYGFRRFFDTVDVLVMGRNTFEKVLSFDKWPYGDKPVVVLSSRLAGVPEHLAKTVEIASGSPVELVNRLSERGVKHVYIDGGVTIQQFLQAGLVHSLTIARIPILIGSGIPLFGLLSRDIPMRHIQTRSYPNGLVQSEYEVLPNGN